MEAEQVVEKILSEAGKETDAIKKQAEEQTADEQQKLDRQLTQFGDQTAALAEAAAERMKMQLLAAARMEIVKDNLAEKKSILDEVFEKARRHILEIPDEQYLRMMQNLMLKAVETGDEEVVVDSVEKRIDKEFIDEINSQLGDDFKRDLKLAEQRENIGAGFILRRGKIKNNASLDVLLDQCQNKLEVELAKDLFES